ncbi:2,5-dichloro-2,5-cyclohexadiene-1,4-diol dehydrogenase [Actinosynnema sp. ALI-1.44]|uniref:SDR family NAD(P)-dependent oxidoreductase n=1 Tax=Actinosynnema sp. ALI-1.44 TaxID=1933779 RepID=UPI00097C91CD|nr:SDR family oxidoreductase [Actinosynnema sp. ALI-1.44]ONI87038.1 2,5-dichloro-2,5-cyclohexadiene-1,4-diol dehydrogenase [Actinosynnema sp. ALI-1.44]
MADSSQPLRDRVAIVTGASSGIGAQIARELGSMGAKIALVGRDAQRLAAVAGQLTAAGAVAEPIAADLTSGFGPAEVVDRTLARFGGIDVLVHAAGIFQPTPFTDTTDEQLDDQWATNVRAPFRLTRAAAEHLGDGSSVIFVSSICGHVGFPNSSAYCATKGAVELLVKSLTAEFAPRGIRVNAVAPGNVRTSMNAHLFEDADYERQMLDSTPAGRVGEVHDIAPAVAFLASPAASYIHGSSLLIDGGWVAS